jgi:hypothetical protein
VEITANVARSEDEAVLQAQGRSLVDEEAEETTAGYEATLEDEDDEESADEAGEAAAEAGADSAPMAGDGDADGAPGVDDEQAALEKEPRTS